MAALTIRQRTLIVQSFSEIFQDNKIDLLMMRDKAHFHMYGFVNKQNLQDCATVNPQLMQEKSLHTQRVFVWFAIMHDHVIGSYFFNMKKVSQKLLIERGTETCSIHFLHQVSSKWIIVMNYGYLQFI